MKFSLVFAVTFLACAAFTRAQEPATSPTSSTTSTNSISREVKDIFDKAAKAVVKIRGTDQH
ncbi:MAG: hypothetical protein LC627_01435, partial [Verrucomicrobiaceae bacterium]|nr:hypothetical protein [Verrucomicrobiaceae bacterium]